MSRIQHILDKAERDGGLQRMRPIADARSAAIGAPDDGEIPLLGPDLIGGRAHTMLEPGRSVRDTRIDPLLVVALAPDAPSSEQYRALRMRVSHADDGSPAHVLLVTSPGRREGKTLTAANLALTMARDHQRRICIVDADFRYPRMHRLFGLADGPGLADVLTGRFAMPDALTLIEDQQITLLPAGHASAHPGELLGGPRMREVIDTLRSHFDGVVIDAPAAAPLADLGLLAPLADRVVLVVRAGQTTKPAIQEAVAAIGAERLLGIVLNDSAN
jgi:capsular exopolysaccharide synthesis family protein